MESARFDVAARHAEARETREADGPDGIGADAIDGPGSAARFCWPSGMPVDGSGNVYVADSDNDTIRKITPGGVVTTFAGTAGTRGSADGTGSAARFNYPGGVAVDASGNLYVADGYNNNVRKGIPSLADVATIDQATGAVGTARQLDTSPQTATSWQWSIIRIPSGSSASLSSTTIRNPVFTPDVPDLFVFRLNATGASGNQSITTVQLMAKSVVATPTFSPAAGTYIGPQGVTISCATSGATVYYTLDGSTPTPSSAQYASAIGLNVSGVTTIQAYAVASGMIDSAVASATYTVYVPASGGVGQPTPNIGATATDPVSGISITVASSSGGVLQFNVTQNNNPLPPGDTVQTTITDASGKVLATISGPQPIYQFTDPGIYIATALVTDTAGNVVGTTKITLPISAAETAETVATTPPSSMSIASATVKGKLLFNASTYFESGLRSPTGSVDSGLFQRAIHLLPENKYLTICQMGLHDQSVAEGQPGQRPIIESLVIPEGQTTTVDTSPAAIAARSLLKPGLSIVLPVNLSRYQTTGVPSGCAASHRFKSGSWLAVSCPLVDTRM